MNIIMAHNFYQISGGEDQSYKSEASILEIKGHNVIRFEMNNNSIKRKKILLTSLYTIWNSESVKTLKKMIKSEKIDLIHFQNTFPLISPAAYYAALERKVVVIQSLRNYRMTCINGLLFRDGKICQLCLGKPIPYQGITHKCYRDSYLGSIVVTSMNTLHKMVRTYESKVDMYIAISEFVKRKYVEIGIPSDKIHVKPNFVISNPIVGKGSGGYALFVGRLSEEKGIQLLITTWLDLKIDVSLWIVGEGPLQSLVKEGEERSKGRIKYLGRKSIKDTYELMGEAAVVVVPSEWYEPFGRVVIEAYAKGTPVITSNLGGLPELVVNGKTGFIFDPLISGDLPKKVETFFSELTKRAEMREAARLEFESKYSEEKNYLKLMEIYEYALLRKKNPPTDN